MDRARPVASRCAWAPTASLSARPRYANEEDIGHHRAAPDGRWVVFESNRLGDYALFLFDTQNPSKGAVQIIDTRYGAQHAKFMSSGTSLILCAHPTSNTPWAIATLDISAFIK